MLLLQIVFGLVSFGLNIQALAVATGNFANRKQLLNDLLSTYNKLLIPEVGPANNVVVSHSIELLRIIRFDDQVLTLDTYVSMSWMDNQLVWSPENYGGLKEIQVPVKLLWQPDILLTNNAGEDNGVHSSDINAVVTFDGSVFYSPPVQISAFCNMPDQLEAGNVVTCSLGYTSWTYHGLALDLKNRSDRLDFQSEKGRNFNKQWRVASSKVKRNVKQYDCCPESYIDLQYTLHLKYIGK